MRWLWLIICMAVFLCRFSPDPEVGNVSTTDIARYNAYGKYTIASLNENFNRLLPEKSAFSAEDAAYTYLYNCALLGDPSFYIELSVHYADTESFNNELSRIKALGDVEIISDDIRDYYLLQCDGQAMNHYLDETVYDGLQYRFEFAVVDKERFIIRYFTAALQDSGVKPESLTVALISIHESQPLE